MQLCCSSVCSREPNNSSLAANTGIYYLDVKNLTVVLMLISLLLPYPLPVLHYSEHLDTVFLLSLPPSSSYQVSHLQTRLSMFSYFPSILTFHHFLLPPIHIIKILIKTVSSRRKHNWVNQTDIVKE